MPRIEELAIAHRIARQLVTQHGHGATQQVVDRLREVLDASDRDETLIAVWLSVMAEIVPLLAEDD